MFGVVGSSGQQASCQATDWGTFVLLPAHPRERASPWTEAHQENAELSIRDPLGCSPRPPACSFSHQIRHFFLKLLPPSRRDRYAPL